METEPPVIVSLLAAVVVAPFPFPAATAKPANCSIPRPCAVVANASTGNGLQASSAGGIGVFGASAAGSYLGAGVDGESSNQNGMDAGGTFGAGSETGGIPFYGILGYGTSLGAYGETEATGTSAGAAGSALFGYDAGGRTPADDYNAGVTGETAYGTGVLGLANAMPSSSAFGSYPIGVYGAAYGNGANGIGVTGEGNDLGVLAYNPSVPSQVELAGPNLIIAYELSTGDYFFVSNTGDGAVSGTFETSKGTYVRARGSSGAERRVFGAQTTLPQIEDVGEAQLANGRALVPIDAAFGDTIDARAGYHVFVTPEGDCKGLYVTRKTAAGFVVRELQGGRSTLAFEYRIVAKPRALDGKRLALAPSRSAVRAGSAFARPRSAGPLPLPLTPEARLRARVGDAGFARAMLDHRER